MSQRIRGDTGLTPRTFLSRLEILGPRVRTED